MGQASSNHNSVRPAQVANTPLCPQCLANQPPAAPPTKKPTDCSVLYTPSAAPRAWAGASRDTKLGWLASKVLKPRKNASKANPSPATEALPALALHHNPNCTSSSKPMETRNTARK